MMTAAKNQSTYSSLLLRVNIEVRCSMPLPRLCPLKTLVGIEQLSGGIEY